MEPMVNSLIYGHHFHESELPSLYFITQPEVNTKIADGRLNNRLLTSSTSCNSNSDILNMVRQQASTCEDDLLDRMCEVLEGKSILPQSLLCWIFLGYCLAPGIYVASMLIVLTILGYIFIVKTTQFLRLCHFLLLCIGVLLWHMILIQSILIPWL